MTTNGRLLNETVGTKSNRDRIGVSIRIHMAAGSEQFGFVSPVGSYLLAHDKRVHFGLGRERQVKLQEIPWSSGMAPTWLQVAANQIILVREAAQ